MQVRCGIRPLSAARGHPGGKQLDVGKLASSRLDWPDYPQRKLTKDYVQN
jgi:hypothetical protein